MDRIHPIEPASRVYNSLTRKSLEEIEDIIRGFKDTNINDMTDNLIDWSV